MEQMIPNICLEWLDDGGLMAIRMFQWKTPDGVMERGAIVIDFEADKLETVSAREFLEELNLRLKIEE